MVRRDFFISYTKKSGNGTKNDLFPCITAIIKLAYEMAGDHVLQNGSVKPREIQAISASQNFHDFLDVIKVMNARTA